MTDLSLTVIPKSDQLNADDLIAGPRTVTITRVSANPDSMEQPVSVFFEGDNGKPYKPCKSMRRVLIAAWGPKGDDYRGRRMTLYCDPKVKFGGLEVGGIRISHMSHIAQPLNMALTVTKAKRAPYRVEPLPDEPDAPDTAAIIGKAEEQAAKGSDAFKAWWNTPEAKAHRALLKEHLNRLRDIAEGADKSDGDDSDPFDLPPLKPRGRQDEHRPVELGGDPPRHAAAPERPLRKGLRRRTGGAEAHASCDGETGTRRAGGTEGKGDPRCLTGS